MARDLVRVTTIKFMSVIKREKEVARPCILRYTNSVCSWADPMLRWRGGPGSSKLLAFTEWFDSQKGQIDQHR